MKRMIFVAMMLAATGAEAQNYYQPYQPSQQYQPYQQQPYQPTGGGNYSRDLYECQQYADQISPAQDAFVGAVGGAATGAALGALTGAMVKGVSVGEGAGYGAAAGGVLGLAGGAYTGVQNKRAVVSNCMRGRGYSY